MSIIDQNLIAKVPPHSIEAEESLLGSLLIDKDAIIKVADTVGAIDFYKDSHRIIYETIRELYSNQEPIDIITLANRLEEKKQLVTIGGRTYLAHLSNAVATSGNISNYGGIIQRKATLRRLQQAAAEISSMSFNEEKDID